MKCRVEKGVAFMGVAFRELLGGRSRWRLPQSRDRALQGSTHCGHCVHGSHLLPMDHDRRNDCTPATLRATTANAAEPPRTCRNGVTSSSTLLRPSGRRARRRCRRPRVSLRGTHRCEVSRARDQHRVDRPVLPGVPALARGPDPGVGLLHPPGALRPGGRQSHMRTCRRTSRASPTTWWPASRAVPSSATSAST
jgi:hypothetical protein